MASKDAALYKTNGLLWPKRVQGTHSSRVPLTGQNINVKFKSPSLNPFPV